MYFSLSEEIKKYPFVRLILPLVFGISVSLFFYIPIIISVLFLVISIILFLVFSLHKSYSNQIIPGILINLILFFSGIFLTQYKVETAKTIRLTNDNGLIIGEIYENPKISENYISLKIAIQAINHNKNWIATSGRTLLYVEKDSLAEFLKIGDLIVFSPEFSEISNKGNPEEFDYKKYLSYHLIYDSNFLSSTDWSLLETSKNIKLKYKILRFRTKLINTLSDLGLSDDELSVVSALALGYKDNLSSEIRHFYSSSGAMHILAVSGLHVGIVYGMIMFFLSFMRSQKLKILKIIIVILFIWFYAALTGLSPSVSRASLMFTIAALGSLQKHKSISLNSVAISAFILLIINPLNLVDVGFQLSYIAVIGIIIMQPKFNELFEPKNKLVSWLWSTTTVSVAAQIATAPLCIYYFNQFSNYFLITNYILIPISTIAIWMCIITFVFSGIASIGIILAKVLSLFVKIMNSSVQFIESLPFSVSSNLYINMPQMVFLYIFIVVIFIFFFASKRYKDLVIAFISLIAFSCINLYQTIENRNQKYFIVYNINKATAINLIDGRDNILLANLDQIDTDKIKLTAKNNWLKKGLNTEKYINLSSEKNNILTNISTIDNRRVFYKQKIIGFEGIKILVLDTELIVPATENKLQFDYLVLSNNVNVSLESILNAFSFKTLIIDASNSDYVIKRYLSEDIAQNLSYHNVKSDGAFVLKIND
ncbi:competence protein ComEC family protein [Bacteroidales bacterium OttesenSCG-928-I21]|nr:competence protein ComEC family protein [Bacteroidales bacterium OttesenSCG-928-I21]